jgi:hypothetical protein
MVETRGMPSLTSAIAVQFAEANPFIKSLSSLFHPTLYGSFSEDHGLLFAYVTVDVATPDGTE